MAVKAGYCTPMLHVAEVERSLKFYGLLGFETIDTDCCEPIGWARVHCAGGAIMFLRAEEPIDPKRYGTMLCMYTPDLPGLRDQLLAAGLKVPAIRYPQYMPSGEVQFPDPDGNSVILSHWGKEQREAWEKRIGGKA